MLYVGAGGCSRNTLFQVRACVSTGAMPHAGVVVILLLRDTVATVLTVHMIDRPCSEGDGPLRAVGSRRGPAVTTLSFAVILLRCRLQALVLRSLRHVLRGRRTGTGLCLGRALLKAHRCCTETICRGVSFIIIISETPIVCNGKS